MTIQDQRRKGFEEFLTLFENGTPDFTQDAFGGYVEIWMQDRWILWNAALDSVVIELPKAEYFGDYWSGDWAIKPDDCREAIEAAGIKVKS